MRSGAGANRVSHPCVCETPASDQVPLPVILCENATFPSLLVVDRVMMSTSPLSPICAPVNRTDSTST